MKKIEVKSVNNAKIVGWKDHLGNVRLTAKRWAANGGYILLRPNDPPVFVEGEVLAEDKHTSIREGDTLSITF